MGRINEIIKRSAFAAAIAATLACEPQDNMRSSPPQPTAAAAGSAENLPRKEKPLSENVLRLLENPTLRAWRSRIPPENRVFISNSAPYWHYGAALNAEAGIKTRELPDRDAQSGPAETWLRWGQPANNWQFEITIERGPEQTPESWAVFLPPHLTSEGQPVDSFQALLFVLLDPDFLYADPVLRDDSGNGAVNPLSGSTMISPPEIVEWSPRG